MSRDYAVVNNYSGLGKMGISVNAIATIASKALGNVQGAVLTKKEKRFFSLDKPVKVSMNSEGKAKVEMDVSLAEGAPVGDLCLKIQKEVAGAIAMMCDTVPLTVKVRVSKVG